LTGFNISLSLQQKKQLKTQKSRKISTKKGWGVYVTSGIGGIITLEQQILVNKEKGPTRVSPFLITQMIIDAIPAYIALKYGFRGETNASVAACASSAKTIGQAMLAIERGDLDIVITGGSDAPFTPTAVAAFASMRAISRRNDDPQHASRPFDKGRDGFVIGEGAGILVTRILNLLQKEEERISTQNLQDMVQLAMLTM